MKPVVLIGIALIVLGAIALAYQGITYTTQERVLQIGPLEATKKTEKTIPLPPLLGGVSLAAGDCVGLHRKQKEVSWTVEERSEPESSKKEGGKLCRAKRA